MNNIYYFVMELYLQVSSTTRMDDVFNVDIFVTMFSLYSTPMMIRWILIYIYLSL